jgi:hypothetical protein
LIQDTHHNLFSPVFRDLEGVPNMRSKVVIALSLPLLLISLSAFAAVEGLVLYMPFDGSIEDASESENQGEIFGNEEWVDGKYGQAMEFDGSTYIEVPDVASGAFDGVPGLTIEVWVRQEAHHDNGIVVKLTAAGVWWPCSYNLETWSDQLAYFGVNEDTGAWATGSYPLEEWFHFTGVFDNGEERTYVNGELAGSVDDPSDTVADGELPVYIGCVAPNSYLFVGELDELAIYNRVLTEEEIRADMNNGISTSVEAGGKLAITWAGVKSR